ncbi:hypothetical protein BO83DRAFT_441045 [Aspergillus eucalypticola CBS 122712]|uniref:Uncharacterized protein n=1 Tax=Aspergillus eucalypticola (strain CBS 122712 / IBT 29274) TaxID=1448314 RepID=A0A317UV55_ASPEC|nr:uncharacterized protein BO83DRAFT_441045 [Aspergillus eucalypticola CBS 122712]PWY63950.1 hypothetical protein BO83DRAFT_441045 [Aspergillus eucalypticola CBS 122712]
MASYEDEIRPVSPPQASPEVSNLDIRSTWSGSLDEPVNCRISMVAHCIPNTQLSILNVRSAGVSIVNTQLVRLQPDQYSDGTWSSSSSPSSPLFAFSSTTTDSYPAHSPISGSELFEGHVRADIENSARDLVSSVDGTAGGHSNCHIGTDQLGHPSAHTSSVSVISDEYTRIIDAIKQHNLGKRSAAAAGLTDSPPGSDTEDHSRKATRKDHITNISPAKPEPKREILEGWADHDRHPVSDSLFVAKERHNDPPSGAQSDHTTQEISSSSMHHKGIASAFEVKGIASDMQLEASDACATLDSSPAHPDTNEKPDRILEQPVMERSSFGGVNADFSSIDKITWLPEPSHEGTVKASGKVRKGPSRKRSSAGSSLSVPAVKEAPLYNSSPREVLMVADSEPKEITEPRRLPKLTIPQPSHEKTTDEKGTPTQIDVESHSNVHCEPVLTIDSGTLIVKNPSKLQPGHYKFIVTVSVSLRQRKQSGWNDLVIQGLPKLVTGEFGYLLFLMPEEHGLEFRTTNLQRHKVVENCFLGEFSYAGDLVIPLRRCDRTFYGVVKDFTVHQEIRAEYAVASAKAESPPELQATYHAVCSVRLHNRCFWAETCCLILSVDGGPDSVYRSNLDAQESGLKMIHIPARENVGIGSAYLQIVCSPRDLELFCVNWTVRLPQHQAISWLPRIYPGFTSPSDRVRHHLRRTFEKVEAVSDSRIERSRGYEMEEPGIDGSKKPADKSAVAVVADLPGEDKQPLDSCTNESIPRSDNIVQKMRLVFICAIYVLGIILAFWLNNTIIDAVASPTKATPTVTDLAAESLNMSQPKTLRWPSYIGQPDMSWEGNSKDDPTPGVSISVEANEEVTMVVETTKVGHESTRSAPAAPQSPESPRSEHELTFRDRIDYWLGWRGPVESEIHGETVA